MHSSKLRKTTAFLSQEAQGAALAQFISRYQGLITQSLVLKHAR